MKPEIRLEAGHDSVSVGGLLHLAFGGDEEARLVERLRTDDEVVASLVAVVMNQVIGQVLFSRLALQGLESKVLVAALAPLAVRPDWQRKGLGTRLVRAGLAHCSQRGVQLVLVLGDPAYYSRFGFSSEQANGLDGTFAGPAFMGLELTPGVLPGRRAKVGYAAAFGLN